MSDFKTIKKRIHDEQKIEKLLEMLGCWGIETEQGGQLYVAGLPNGDNSRSVQVRNSDNLISHIRSKGVSGDIFDVVSYIKFDSNTLEKRKLSVTQSKYWICKKLGYYEYIDEFYKVTSDTQENRHNYNSWLSKFKQKDKNIYLENEVQDQSILQRFGFVPYLNWLQEGITISTQKFFGVGIDVISERITFPIHNKHGKLIGVKGRYVGKDKEIEQKYKYIYIVPCNKSIEFFNLHRALPHIKNKNEVIIVEGAKTVMLLFQWGFKNAISIEGDSLSNAQIHLLKEMNIDTRYVFAFDKDKDTNFVYEETSKLKGRMKFAIYDKDDLLNFDKKESPGDQGISVWKKLYEKYLFRIKN